MDALSRGQQSVVGKELSHVAVPMAIKVRPHLLRACMLRLRRCAGTAAPAQRFKPQLCCFCAARLIPCTAPPALLLAPLRRHALLHCPPHPLPAAAAMQAKSHLDLSEAVHKGSDLLSISYAEGLTVNFSVSGALLRPRCAVPRPTLHATRRPRGRRTQRAQRRRRGCDAPLLAAATCPRAGGTLMLDDARTKAMFGEGANGRTTLGGLDPTPAELAPLVAKIDEIIASGKAQA